MDYIPLVGTISIVLGYEENHKKKRYFGYVPISWLLDPHSTSFDPNNWSKLDTTLASLAINARIGYKFNDTNKLLGEIVLLKNTEPSWWEAWFQLQSTANIPLNPLRILKPATFPCNIRNGSMTHWIGGENDRKTPFFCMFKPMGFRWV